MNDYRLISGHVSDIGMLFGAARVPDDIISTGLDYIGKWRINVNRKGYGIAHRIALKKDTALLGEDDVLLVIHFAVPVAKKDLKIPIGVLRDMYEQLAGLIEDTASLASEKLERSVGCMYLSTPDPMKRELELLLENYEPKPSPR